MTQREAQHILKQILSNSALADQFTEQELTVLEECAAGQVEK